MGQGQPGQPGAQGPQGPKGDSGTVGWNDFNESQKLELINKLKVFPEFKGPVGPQGPAVDINTLATKTMWCANGEICELPAGKSAKINGSIILTNNSVLSADSDNWIRYKNKDGAYTGMGIATDNLFAENKLNVNGVASFNNTLQLPGGWTIYNNPGNGGLTFAKNGEERFFIGPSSQGVQVYKNNVWTKL